MTTGLNLRDVAIGLLVALCVTLPTLVNGF